MSDEKEVEMVVAGLVLDPASNAPIVILKVPDSDTCLPIWIGLSEATAIASALKQVQLARPMTHDLLCNITDELGGSVLRIMVTKLQDNTFYAAIELSLGEAIKVIDSRPSDAIAVAVRTGAPIVVDSEVLAQAHVTLVSVAEQQMEDFNEDKMEVDSDDQNFANIEKEKWEEILADMDPDDFKYKM